MKKAGIGILLYINGVDVAVQKDLTLNVDRKLIPASGKQDGSWESHILGSKSVTIAYNALQSTTGLSGAGLFDILTGAKSALLVITGFTVPIIAEVDLQNSNINAPQDEATTIQGTFKVNGKLYRLSGDNAALVTNPGNTHSYDTFTVSGTKVTSAINVTGGANAYSNSFSVTEDDIVKVALYLTKTSGEIPSVELRDSTTAELSNKVALVEGLNFVILVATGTDANSTLWMGNTAAAVWSTSNIYCFKAN